MVICHLGILKGKISRIDTPYGCIRKFVKHYMKMDLQNGCSERKVGEQKGFLFSVKCI